MELTIPSSKTDPFRKRIKLAIAASNDSACPLYAMQQFLDLDTNWPQHAPLFCIGQHKQQAFTREYVVQKLQSLAFTAALGHSTWNGHSFRRGAATWATEMGLSENEIQSLGRSKSNAYKTYIKYSDRERILLSKRFQTLRNPNT